MPLTDRQLERYTRQIVLPHIEDKGQKKLLESKILLVGAGGLSSASLMYLAASGVGTIGIIDHDKVDLSNLHRQIIFSTNDVGMSKVQCAQKNINKLNPDVKIISFEEKIDENNINHILEGFDIVIDGLDNFKDKFLINDTCVSLNKKLVHAGVIGFEGQILTIIPKVSACLRCYLPEIPKESQQNCRELGVLGSCAGVISTLVATEVIKLILDIGEPLINRVLKYDALNTKFYELKLPGKSPNCKAHKLP